MRLKNKWDVETWRLAGLVNGFFAAASAAVGFIVDPYSFLPLSAYLVGMVVGLVLVLTCMIQGQRGLPCPWCELSRLHAVIRLMVFDIEHDEPNLAAKLARDTVKIEYDVRGEGKTTLGDWKAVIIDALVVNHTYSKEHDTDPRKALADLIAYEQKIALDPAVSPEARALIDSIAKTVREGEFICSKCGIRHALGEPPKGDF